MSISDMLDWERLLLPKTNLLAMTYSGIDTFKITVALYRLFQLFCKMGNWALLIECFYNTGVF